LTDCFTSCLIDAGNMTLESLHLGTNIKTIKWAPQNDVLGHPSVKAFVMQGGINSLYEAAYHAKPVVVMPFIADQAENAAKVRPLQAAVNLDAMHCWLS